MSFLEILTKFRRLISKAQESSASIECGVSSGAPAAACSPVTGPHRRLWVTAFTAGCSRAGGMLGHSSVSPYTEKQSVGPETCRDCAEASGQCAWKSLLVISTMFLWLTGPGLLSIPQRNREKILPLGPEALDLLWRAVSRHGLLCLGNAK